MVYDTFYYDSQTRLWCALAVGLGLPENFKVTCECGRMTNEWARDIIEFIGSSMNGIQFQINPLKGTPGQFFRDNRPADLETVCRELIVEKQNSDAGSSGVASERTDGLSRPLGAV